MNQTLVKKEPRVHPLILVLIAITLGAFGQIFLKSGMTGMSLTGSVAGQFKSLFVFIFTRPAVLIGILLYMISTLFWLKILTTQELSYVYPMIAVSYVTVTILSIIFLREQVSAMRWLSLLVICIGVGMLAVLGGNNKSSAAKAQLEMHEKAPSENSASGPHVPAQ